MIVPEAFHLLRQKEPMSELIPNSKSYLDLLGRLKEQIRTAQVKAALAVNTELILLYWNIGKQILERQSTEGWGTSPGSRRICAGSSPK